VHTANTSSRVIASSVAGAVNATLSRLGTWARWCFNCFANRIGIGRYSYRSAVAGTEARPLKHCKHETSTKHQCVGTIRLEVTSPGCGLTQAHTGSLLAQGSRMNEHGGASPSRDFDVRASGPGNRRAVTPSFPNPSVFLLQPVMQSYQRRISRRRFIRICTWSFRARSSRLNTQSAPR
jgi:hypothetical protein